MIEQVETFYGIIRSPEDVVILLEACRRGLLPRVTKRMSNEERACIRSGSVFVYDETESGIRRWTDGRAWSPSRIQGDFLVYREVEKKLPPPRSPMDYQFPKGEVRGKLTKDDEQGLTGPLTSQKASSRGECFLICICYRERITSRRRG